MSSRASIAGHPIHPMLVPIPIGLFVFALIADIVAVNGGGDGWALASFYAMGVGIAGALIAAVFGLIDLFSLTDDNVKKIGITHMVINLAVVAVFAVNFGLRWDNPAVDGMPLFLSVVGIGLLLVSGWLGGHMVYVHGVAVEKRGTNGFVERRRVQKPVAHERRRMHGAPIGQH